MILPAPNAAFKNWLDFATKFQRQETPAQMSIEQRKKDRLSSGC
jgi:hypothetical protein